ncbi:MAG TPA: response regulator [Ferruginibacter sp.]|nr:response regulator [Ferruginibacter sp.]
MKILIVDSSAWIPDRIASLLTEAEGDHTLYKALTYKEAVSLFHETEPAVVILDKSLPDKGSISLLTEIKAAKKNTMVIVLSLRIDLNAEQLCKRAGADFILDKYHEFERIPAIISSINLEINA